ncbi:MAG: transporter [Bacillales bacterium]|jgi:nitrite transporter NirC|nr:transporter [Bacillales bacterium]
MINESVNYLEKTAIRKKELINNSILEFYVRAILATLYLGLALVVSLRLGDMFHQVDSPATYFMAAAFFGMALILIIYGGAELFTGNTMYFTVSTIRKSTTMADLVKNWIHTYVGNLLGAVIIAAILYFAGVFKDIPEEHFLYLIAHKKATGAFVNLLFKGILCNWLVCLACFLPMMIKENGAKIAMIMLVIFMFFISGYEHSVANMVYFAVTIAQSGFEVVTIQEVVSNLIPVTIGNIIGGSVFVGMLYTYFARGQENNNMAVEKKSA